MIHIFSLGHIFDIFGSIYIQLFIYFLNDLVKYFQMLFVSKLEQVRILFLTNLKISVLNNECVDQSFFDSSFDKWYLPRSANIVSIRTDRLRTSSIIKNLAVLL
jgi:hypothetical protein